MSDLLDRMAKAVYESMPELKKPGTSWESLDDESHRCGRTFALAAVEVFAEEVCKLWCGMCKDGHEPRFDAESRRWYHPGTTFCNAEDVRNLLASLRAEVKP